MKKAILVLGPESSGTRFVTKCFIAAGCDGSDDHRQPWDLEGDQWDKGGGNFKDASDRIVWRRSVPHGLKWPPIDDVIESLLRAEYTIYPIIVVRDFNSTVKSQVKCKHALDEEKAARHILRAFSEIFGAISASFVVCDTLKPPYIFTYESLLLDKQYIVNAIKYCGLKIYPDKLPEIIDGNKKYMESL